MEVSDTGRLSRENKCAMALRCVGICAFLKRLKTSWMAGQQGEGVVCAMSCINKFVLIEEEQKAIGSDLHLKNFTSATIWRTDWKGKGEGKDISYRLLLHCPGEG